jgi:hypothetical protein
MSALFTVLSPAGQCRVGSRCDNLECGAIPPLWFFGLDKQSFGSKIYPSLAPTGRIIPAKGVSPGNAILAGTPVLPLTSPSTKLMIENSSVLSPNGAIYTSEGREPWECDSRLRTGFSTSTLASRRPKGRRGQNRWIDTTVVASGYWRVRRARVSAWPLGP